MSQSVAVDSSARPKADEARVEAQSLLDAVLTSTILTDDDEEVAVETIREIKRRIAETEKLRKFFVDPLNKVIRQYNDFFGEPVKLLKRCEQDLKQKVAAYSQQKQEKNQRALAEAARAETAEEARAIVASVSPAENPAGTSIRYKWVFEIVDEGAVPRELCSPDPKKIEAALAVGDGVPQAIPGIVWKQRPIVTVRK